MLVSATKRFYFEAAHNLPGHVGLCKNLHGHSYKLEVTIRRSDKPVIEEGSSAGMVTDFSNLKEIVNTAIISKVDHKNLNEVFKFRPTAENMAIWVFEKLSQILAPMEIEVVSVKLWETKDAYAEVTL